MQPNWSDLIQQATPPAIPEKESAATYWYFAIALFGAAMTPYAVFFFSSGAVEERWTTKDLGTSRLNVLVGFRSMESCRSSLQPARRLCCCPIKSK